jgi:DNA/RNA-binding domain of Phe-tRNA-synthetase-like protein
MTFEVSERIIEAYPDLRIGVVVATGVANSGSDPGLLSLTDEVVANFRRQYSPEQVLEHPNIAAWRNTYRSFGVNPKKHKPTAEAFCSRIAKGDAVPWISKVVNAYLLAELEFFLPVGGYDLELITGAIILRHSPGGEEFVPLGAQPGSDPQQTQAGEIVYTDNTRVLTRSWNRKDSESSKITEASTRIALFAEAADSSIRTEDVVQIAERIKEYLVRFCSANARAFLIEPHNQAKWEVEEPNCE